MGSLIAGLKRYLPHVAYNSYPSLIDLFFCPNNGVHLKQPSSHSPGRMLSELRMGLFCLSISCPRLMACSCCCASYSCCRACCSCSWACCSAVRLRIVSIWANLSSGVIRILATRAYSTSFISRFPLHLPLRIEANPFITLGKLNDR
jgi:hypothetical protein